MSSYTPGPWMANDAEVWGTHAMRFNLTTGGTPMIAAVCKHEDAERAFPYKANARLIAAAPEQHEALQATQLLLERLGLDSSDEYQRNAYVIAKATGEKK